MKRAGALVCAGLAALVSACDSGGSDDGSSSLVVSMTSVPPPAGSDEVVWIAEGGRGGDILLVDVLARDVTQPFDAYEIIIVFDPNLLKAESAAEGGALDTCSPLPVVTADNIATGANTTGELVVSGVADAAGCTVTGMRALARITFRALEEGTSSLSIDAASRLFRTSIGHPSVPVTYFDSQASVLGER